MEAGFESGLSRREMNVIRRDDGNKVHLLAFGQLGLLGHHGHEVCVAATFYQVEILA